ncbi:hypothetical protein QWZ16_15320 [Vibrio ostreicida]|uniref:Uncharacterized protein n=1 Tax=Vibrio ostreicida TaxID=526588 RepID=A0ABT8BXD3_9VIBR|nr:hypothetical protein [Vibrio ostreicida]MDN3611044.1 hypothetical protein [Vibrio ostreicida]
MTQFQVNNQSPVTRLSAGEIHDDTQVTKARLPDSRNASNVVDTVNSQQKSKVVSADVATEALQRVLSAFHKGDDVTVSQLEKASMNDMVLMAANLGSKRLVKRQTPPLRPVDS